MTRPALALLLLGACTHYGTTSNYGPRSEIARRLVGSPMVETTTAANLQAGFGAATVSDGYGSSVTAGGLDASHATVQRTHCVQQAQIDYVQPIDIVPVVEGRQNDVGGAIGIAALGLLVMGVAAAAHSVAIDSYNSEYEFYQMDPSFFPRPDYPSSPTGAYYAGGGLMIGGAAWLVYSLGSLPKGQPPAPSRTERRWTETAYVEATGCGLVPADQPPQY